MRPLTTLLLLAAVSYGQPTAKRPEFEVASIKQSAGGDGRFIGTGKSGGFDAKNTPLKNLIAEAYQVKTFQIYGGPAWLASDTYDITAKRDIEGRNAAETREGFEAVWVDLMLRLQVLLEDRCSLKVHKETKELPVYVLTIAKSGLKLEPSNCVVVDSEHPATPAPGQPRPKYCGNSGTTRNGLNAVMTGYGIKMSDLLRWLSNSTSRTVIDKTGYTEEFNARVEWTPDAGLARPGTDEKSTPAADTTGPTIFTALQEQLGLKLESAKGPVEVLVIDHVEKPSAN
jgi:uncharacterized protein (TIGR03435 family)